MSDFRFYMKKCSPLLLMAAAVMGGFYINNSVKEGLRNELTTAQNELEAMQTDIDLSQQRMDDYNRALEDISGYSHFIFAENAPQKLIDRLKSDANGEKAVLSDFRFDIPEFIRARDNTETMALMRFHVSLTGGYYSLWNFIKTLEGRPYLESIEEMSLSAHNPAGSELKMDLKGSFRVFDKKMVEWCAGDGT
jgi:hypothetical protein